MLLLLVLCAQGLLAQGSAALRGRAREISGVVLNTKTGLVLRDAEVTLTESSSRKLLAQTLTDSEGRFVFAGLRDGKYGLYASHRGYVGAQYDEHAGGVFTAIVTGEGLVSTGLQFRLAPLSVIFGTVAEDSGDPVDQALLSLFRKDERGGTGKLVRAGMTHTNEAGRYEIPSLPPGTYFLCATGIPWYARPNRKPGGEASGSSLDVAYGLTCSPGVSDTASAETIVLTGGERTQIDLTMHAVRAARVAMPAAAASGAVAMPQVRQEMFGFEEQMMLSMSSSTSTDAQGRTTVSAEMTGIAPGRYVVEVPDRKGARTGWAYWTLAPRERAWKACPRSHWQRSAGQ